MRELLSAQMLRGVEIKEAFLEYDRVSDTTACLQPASAVPSSSYFCPHHPKPALISPILCKIIIVFMRSFIGLLW